MISVRIKARVYQETNGSKLHWRKLWERHEEQKKATWLALRSLPSVTQQELHSMGKWFVRIIPYGNKTYDDDGLSAAGKWIRDEICRFLQVDDGDKKRIRFAYAQPKEQDPLHRYSVLVEIHPLSVFRDEMLKELENE
jgi:hypothetical protein